MNNELFEKFKKDIIASNRFIVNFYYSFVEYPNKSEAYLKYADALGKTVSSLSDDEKRQAYMNACLEFYDKNQS